KDEPRLLGQKNYVYYSLLYVFKNRLNSRRPRNPIANPNNINGETNKYLFHIPFCCTPLVGKSLITLMMVDLLARSSFKSTNFSFRISFSCIKASSLLVDSPLSPMLILVPCMGLSASFTSTVLYRF